MAEPIPPSGGCETAPATTENQSIQDSQTLEHKAIEQNPPSTDPQIEEWETKVRDWLSTLAKRRNVSVEEMEAWIGSNQVPLPEHFKSLHRLELYQRVLSIHKLMRRPNQVKEGNSAEPSKARFQRTDQWIPVYAWLESLDRNEVVKSKEISDWLTENPSVKDNLYARHSRYHLMHYVQKCHMKILKRRGKLQKVVKTSSPVSSVKVLNNAVMQISTTTAPVKAIHNSVMQISTTTAPVKAIHNSVMQIPTTTAPAKAIHNTVMQIPTTTAPAKAIHSSVMPSSMTKAQPKVVNNALTTSAAPLQSNPSSNLLNSNEIALAKQNEAFRKYELLTDLENHLTSLLSRHRQVSN